MNRHKVFLAVALAAFVGIPVIAEESRALEETQKNLRAAKNINSAQTEISSVVVFPIGVRTTRSANIKLNAGEQTVLLDGFPLPIDEESILAETGIPNARILSVSTTISRWNQFSDQEIAKTRKRLDDARLREKELNARVLSAEHQLQMLAKLKPVPPALPVPGTPYVFDTESALSALHFLKNEMGRLSKNVLQLKEELTQAQIDREVAESEAQKVSAYTQNAARAVAVKIAVPVACEGSISVHYISDHASWRPSYDLRVDSEKKTMTIVSYGVISQRTGEDWCGVPVTLSTARPDVSANLPEFKKRLISERFILKKSDKLGRELGSVMAASSNTSSKQRTPLNGRSVSTRQVLDDAGQNKIVLASGETFTNVSNIRYQAGNYVFDTANGIREKMSVFKIKSFSQNYIEAETNDIHLDRLIDPARNLRGLDFRYDLARPETIKSTGSSHRYLLKSETYQGSFYYRICPSVNTHAYQMLDVKNTQFRPILAGPANIFYGSDFIGDMDIPYTLREGTVAIPLGIDPRVSVNRQKINAIATVGTFTSSRKNNVSVVIKINNRTPESIRFICEESIPVSTQKEIEISSPKYSPEINSFIENKSIAEWKMTLEPQTEISLKADYAIEYPMNFDLEERTY